MTKLARFFKRVPPPTTPHAPAPESDYRPALRAQMTDDCGLSQASGATRLAEAIYYARLEAYRLQHRPWAELPVDAKRRYVDLASVLLPVLHPEAPSPTIGDLQDLRRIQSGAASWWALQSLGASLKGATR